MTTVCLGQDFTPPPGPSADGLTPNFPVPQNQQPNFPPSGPSSDSLNPEFPSRAGQSPDLGVPPYHGSWPPSAATLPEQPPVTPGPNPDFPAKSNNFEQPDDMMGFGGRGGMGAFGNAMNPTDSIRYAAIWFPSVPVQGQPTDFEMVREDFSFTHPLWKDSLNALSLSGGVRNELIQTDAVLPGTGQSVPSEFWGVNLGLHYSRQLDDGWITGGGVSIGSASDHPFAGIHEMNVGMNAMLRIPQGDHNAWLFTLAYSPMGELAFPVPGVAFSWNPTPQFHANIGLPFMVMWKPTDDWQFQASYMLLRTVHIKAQYRFTEHLRAFAAYDWANESYILLDSPETNDRFFIYDQRVSMGLQLSVVKNWTASVSSGFIFDRYLFEGTSSTSSSANQVYLGSGPFVALNFGGRF